MPKMSISHDHEKAKASYAEDVSALEEFGGSLSPEEDKRILRKLDMW